MIEIDDDSDEPARSLPPPRRAARSPSPPRRGAGAGAGVGARDEFKRLEVNLEQEPSEAPLEYYARLLSDQDSLEAHLNRMSEHMDKLRGMIVKAEHDYIQDLDRAHRESAAAQGFSEQRKAQDVEFELTSGARFRSYEAGKLAMSRQIEELKILYQQQYQDMEVLTSRVNNVRVRNDVRRALMQEFPGMTITEQTAEFRRRYVENNKFGSSRVRCNLQTFMKKYRKTHPGASRASMEKKYKRACQL